MIGSYLLYLQLSIKENEKINLLIINYLKGLNKKGEKINKAEQQARVAKYIQEDIVPQIDWDKVAEDSVKLYVLGEDKKYKKWL